MRQHRAHSSYQPPGFTDQTRTKQCSTPRLTNQTSTKQCSARHAMPQVVRAQVTNSELLGRLALSTAGDMLFLSRDKHISLTTSSRWLLVSSYRMFKHPGLAVDSEGPFHDVRRNSNGPLCVTVSEVLGQRWRKGLLYRGVGHPGGYYFPTASHEGRSSDSNARSF